MTHKIIRPALILFLSVGLASCGSGGGDGGVSTGTLIVSVTDAPVDEADAVVVQFTGVVIQSAEGERHDFDFDAPQQIDLLALQGGGSELILHETLPAGRYNWIRLKVDAEEDVMDSFIDISGTRHPLRIPSGSQTGLKLNRGFTVPAGGTADFTIDFDLRKSVHNPPGLWDNYVLRPTLRIVDNIEVGSIAGTVDQALITDVSCTGGDAVYVFSGLDVTPDDVDGTEPEPVTTAQVKFDPDSSQYEYKAAFLSSGDYTVSFTCQASSDAPETDDAITFVGTANATVVAGTVTTHDF